MDFFDVFRVLVRRWYVSVPALVLAVGVAIPLTLATADPTCVATANVRLVPVLTAPPGPTTVELIALADDARAELSDGAFVQRLGTEGYRRSYRSVLSPEEPVLTLEAADADAPRAAATIDQLVAQYRQAVGDQATLAVSDTTVRRSMAPVRRAMVVSLIVGVALAGGLAIAIDAILRRRHHRPLPVDLFVPPPADPPAARSIARRPLPPTAPPPPPVSTPSPPDTTIVLPLSYRPKRETTDD